MGEVPRFLCRLSGRAQCGGRSSHGHGAPGTIQSHSQGCRCRSLRRLVPCQYSDIWPGCRCPRRRSRRWIANTSAILGGCRRLLLLGTHTVCWRSVGSRGCRAPWRCWATTAQLSQRPHWWDIPEESARARVTVRRGLVQSTKFCRMLAGPCHDGEKPPRESRRSRRASGRFGVGRRLRESFASHYFFLRRRLMLERPGRQKSLRSLRVRPLHGRPPSCGRSYWSAPAPQRQRGRLRLAAWRFTRSVAQPCASDRL